MARILHIVSAVLNRLALFTLVARTAAASVLAVQVDILAWRTKTSRVHAQIKDFCAILSGEMGGASLAGSENAAVVVLSMVS